MKNEHELRNFIGRFLLITLKYALLGGLLGTAVGLGMALLALVAGAGGPMSQERLLAITANYALFGLLGGGIIGLVAGLLTQPR